MIEVRNVSRSFGSLKAINDLSFNVSQGEAVALWGANGAGKTTALRCLLGLIPFQGDVTIGGFDVSRQGKKSRALLGFVPQTLNFHDDLTVQETVDFYAGLKCTLLDDRFQTLLVQLGLIEHLPRPVGELSGGLKQRVALALALLSDPPVLVLDEPTANLDITARDTFLDLLLRLKKSGKTLVFSSHRLEEIKVLADRVLLLEAGRLVLDAPPQILEERMNSDTLLHLSIPEEDLLPALEIFKAEGLAYSPNGTGFWVQLPTAGKFSLLQSLMTAGINVTDMRTSSVSGSDDD